MPAPDYDAFEQILLTWSPTFLEGRSFKQLYKDLCEIESELLRWQRTKNLVSRETLNDIWTRHILDSLQLMKLLPKTDVRLIDFGSGAGFPGLIMAAALKGVDGHIHMVEANQRKVGYLKSMIRRLDLRATVWAERSERLDPETVGPVDVVTGRGFRPLGAFFELTEQFWHPQVTGFLHKGRNFMSEVEIARSDWRFDLVKHISEIDAQSTILQISGLSKASITGR